MRTSTETGETIYSEAEQAIVDAAENRLHDLRKLQMKLTQDYIDGCKALHIDLSPSCIERYRELAMENMEEAVYPAVSKLARIISNPNMSWNAEDRHA